VNVPGLERGTREIGSFRFTVRGEILLAAGILAATAVLSELPPSSVLAEARAAKAPAPQFVVASGSDFATTVRARLTVTPGSVGPNAFEARITDYDTGRPVEATAVSMTFSLPGRPDLGTPTLELKRASPGVWRAQGTILSMDGRWDVTVLVQQPTQAVEIPLKLTTKLPPETIQVQRSSGQPDIYTISLPGGDSLQTYIDPGGTGPNTVHFTFFRPSGQEEPIASATATALTPAGVTADLPLIRFDAGHFAANTRLTAGPWRFQIRAVTRNGSVLTGYFTQRIR
jgi:nitrogen fixation protein FixH